MTGKIVYARWWRNHRFALNDMATVPDGKGGWQCASAGCGGFGAVEGDRLHCKNAGCSMPMSRFRGPHPYEEGERCVFDFERQKREVR